MSSSTIVDNYCLLVSLELILNEDGLSSYWELSTGDLPIYSCGLNVNELGSFPLTFSPELLTVFSTGIGEIECSE